MNEIGIDCMKYRKSTHLAGVDVEALVAEQGKCVLNIKDAFYDTNVDVSGNKTNGYFLVFTENVKPMVVNSGNRKTISQIVKDLKKCTSLESRNIGNWIGLKIELVFDPNVKMMGAIVGGIKVVAKSPIPDISDSNAIAILGQSTTQAELKANWSKLLKDEQALPSVVALKDKLKGELTNA